MSEMYRISVSSEFSSAHALRGHQGMCENMHGHNWHVRLAVSSDTLTDVGLVMDFAELKALLRSVTDKLDHTVLNKIDYFVNKNPSSESLARYIYYELLPLLSDRVSLDYVEVSETARSSARFYGKA